jgi:hypothetical protein
MSTNCLLEAPLGYFSDSLTADCDDGAPGKAEA